VAGSDSSRQRGGRGARIDYGGKGVYDDVLHRSDLGNKLSGEATDPAPCRTVARAAQTTRTASSANSGASNGARRVAERGRFDELAERDDLLILYGCWRCHDGACGNR
jgi:hypothetical protein